MKTLNQIYRYTSDCQFPDEDWQKVLAYCRKRFKGGNIRVSQIPKSTSTYQEFLDWIEFGFGAGDFVSYGNTMGVVGNSTPAGVILAAYCDYDGNLIVNDMEVLEPERLKPLDEARILQLKRLLFEKGVDFHVRFGKFEKLYTPKKYFYGTIENPNSDEPNVGMFLESDNSKYHFLAYLEEDELKMDYWVDSNYTPLKPALEADIKRLHAATSKQGWFYNERCHQFVKAPKKGKDNVYWYLNENFELVMDQDNGSKKHLDRFKAGNYILDYTEGLFFMKEVKKMRGKA